MGENHDLWLAKNIMPYRKGSFFIPPNNEWSISAQNCIFQKFAWKDWIQSRTAWEKILLAFRNREPSSQDQLDQDAWIIFFFGLSTKCIFVSYEIRYCCWVGTSRINQDGVILKLLGGPKRWALLSFCSLWPILGFDLQLGWSSSSGIDTRRIYEGCRRSVA